jgi:hypothetical protein
MFYNINRLSDNRLTEPINSSESEVEDHNKTRNKIANSACWKRNVNKKKRMFGEEYVGFKKVEGKYIQDYFKAKRQLKPICNSKFCINSKTMYCTKIKKESRQELFDRFWKNMSWMSKKVYILSLIEKQNTKRATKEQSRRGFTNYYYLNVDNQRRRVCKTTFLNTFDIKDWTIRYWQQNIKSNPSTIPIQEQNTDVSSKIKSIEQFLDTLPKLPSHYCRKSSNKQYLEPIFRSKCELYRLYQKYSNDSQPASRTFFDTI